MLRISVTKPRIYSLALFLSIFSCISAHSQISAKESAPGEMIDSGSWYSRVKWPHDGNPYESRNFLVYSDAASLETRRQVADIAEGILGELTDYLSIDRSDMFRYPPGQNKIHIYAYKNRFPQTWGARAYYAGLVIWSLDHEQRPADLDSYKITIKHELVHVIEALLKGRDVIYTPLETRVHVWFSEGLGEAITGGTTGYAVRDLGYLNYLTHKYGRVCPISIIHDGMAGDWSSEEKAAESAVAGSEYYYPMYHLAVNYLIDPNGFGRSPQEAVKVFSDIGAGLDFRTAFENRMGISLNEYEKRFFELMNNYLDEGGSLLIRRAAIVWLCLMVVSVVASFWVGYRKTSTRWGQKLNWLFVTIVLGPLGLSAFKIHGTTDGRPASIWRDAVRPTVTTVTWNVAAFVLISALVIPSLDYTTKLTPVNFTFLFILAWLGYYLVYTLALSRGWYKPPARLNIFHQLILMVLSISGLFLVFIPLSKFWWGNYDPGSVYFWGLFPIAVSIGVALVYLYHIKLIRHNFTGTAPLFQTTC